MTAQAQIQSLFDHLEGQHPINDFLDDFPTVTREQAITVLEATKPAEVKRINVIQ